MNVVHEAPKAATLVIFHTAVLAYLPSVTDRQDFARKVRTFCPYWISNEAPQIFPDIARRTVGRDARGNFLLSANGTPIAWTDPHGASLEWLAQDREAGRLPMALRSNPGWSPARSATPMSRRAV